MYVTDLRGLRIISLVSAFRMGTVEDALLDPSCRYVAALAVRQYGPGKRQYIVRDAVQRVGHRAVVLGGSDDEPAPPTLEAPDRLINLRTLIGLEVVSDQGNLMGRVRNAVVDTSTLAIEAYEVAQSGLGRVRAPLRVDASQTLSGSKDVLIVPETAVMGGAQRESGAAPSGRHWLPPDLGEGTSGAGATRS
jgi:sporulation protein YlmC with PRC-barrel domain